MLKIIWGAVLVFPAMVAGNTLSSEQLQQIFTEFQARGTLIVEDQRQERQQTLLHNPERAAQRLSPASTFKIPHTLFALDAGVVTDEFQVFRWDGKPHSFASHNQDQTLRSAMRNSAIWVYEAFAAAIGEEKARQYLQALHYGSADPSGSQPYWIDGRLVISAAEQITFLKALYRNELPFKAGHQWLVKDILVNEAGANWILRAKTGWTGSLGWWVGWVEWPEGPVFFALNIDTPERGNDLYKREAIVRKVLQQLDALPQK